MSEQKIHITRKLLSKRKSLLMHGVGFVTGDPTIELSYPFTFHPGMQVTVTEPGDSKWIYMMLPLEMGSLITDIKIAHHRTGLNSYISLIRLIEQKEPISATVIYNEKFTNDIPSTCVISSGCSTIVNKSILLKVCMNFASKDDIIEIGSVEIRYIPNYATLSSIDKNERIEEEQEQIFKFNGISKETEKPFLLELFSQRKKKTILTSKK